jgi:hypothetical protein
VAKKSQPARVYVIIPENGFISLSGGIFIAFYGKKRRKKQLKPVCLTAMFIGIIDHIQHFIGLGQACRVV